MENERTIGKVVLVESEHVIVELDTSSKSMTKTFLTGTYPIARINSYVLIPVGAVSIVGVVTRISMTEQDLEIAEKGSLTLAHPRRTISVTMVGTMTRKSGKFEFSYGIKEFPALDNPVWFILEEELDVIFDKKPNEKYFIELGMSTAYPEYTVKVNPNLLLSRHLAVLGNTGSGKSCTIASFIQTILQNDEVVKGGGAHFVIFDTNGEYRSAFSKGDKKFSLLHIDQEGLKIPYWFMNFQDWKNLLQPKEGSQIPVLSKALLYARNPSLRPAKYSFSQVKAKIEEAERFYTTLRAKYPEKPKEGTYDYVMKEKEKEIKDLINKIITGERQNEIGDLSQIRDVDMPSHFDREYFRRGAIDNAIEESGANASQIRSYCETMLQRMDRFFTDPRYDFIFHNFMDPFEYALAWFMRLCFGRAKNAKIEELGPLEKVDEHYFVKMYLAKHEFEPKKDYQVVIFDLSLVPSDVLENVTALLGRLILEFMQRIEKIETYKGKDVRGKFPVVLVLEEAHNYIPEMLPKDTESVSKQVFERIAREGRKYGLSLVVSSQRPSELSRTVLSQCNSFITHRIQNPEDQAYIKKLLPTISHGLLNQLPILAQGIALIFGDCVRAPMEVSVRMPNPEPKSDDPKFWEHWTNNYKEDEFQFENGEPDFEEVCFVWEGGKRKIDKKSVYASTQLNAKAKEGKSKEGGGDA